VIVVGVVAGSVVVLDPVASSTSFTSSTSEGGPVLLPWL
jgi:hypothetical protein